MLDQLSYGANVTCTRDGHGESQGTHGVLLRQLGFLVGKLVVWVGKGVLVGGAIQRGLRWCSPSPKYDHQGTLNMVC